MMMYLVVSALYARLQNCSSIQDICIGVCLYCSNRSKMCSNSIISFFFRYSFPYNFLRQCHLLLYYYYIIQRIFDLLCFLLHKFVCATHAYYFLSHHYDSIMPLTFFIDQAAHTSSYLPTNVMSLP